MASPFRKQAHLIPYEQERQRLGWPWVVAFLIVAFDKLDVQPDGRRPVRGSQNHRAKCPSSSVGFLRDQQNASVQALFAELRTLEAATSADLRKSALSGEAHLPVKEM